MNRLLNLSALLAALCLGTLPASAQETRQEVFGTQIAPALRDPSLTSVNTSPLVSLSTSKGDGTLAAEIVTELNQDWLLSLKAEAPLGKGAEEVELANLAGLNTGSTATLGITRIVWDVRPDGLKAFCMEQNKKLLPVRPLRLTISGDECSLETLAARGKNDRGEEWRVVGERAQAQALANSPPVPEKQALAAVCEEYNRSIPEADRCNVRGLKDRSEDWGGQGDIALAEALDETCVEANRLGQTPRLIPQAESANVQSVLRAQGEQPCSMDALPLFWQEKARQKQDKKLEEVCQQHNESLAEGWIHLSGTDESECTYLGLRAKGLGDQALTAIEFGLPKIFSLRVSTGRQSFKIVNPETLVSVDTVKDHTESRDSFSGTLTLGILSRKGTYWGLNAVAKRDYEGSPSNEVCLPIPNTAATQCRQMVLKGPEESESEVYQAELRRFFSLGGSETANLGINPRISYDRDKDAEEYQVLLYFLGNETGLNGGLDLGYRTDTDDFAVRAFVGKAFRLISL
jgi:hypothetical protein